MGKTDFGTSGESTMFPGKCELIKGPDIAYSVNENGQITWIELKGGSEGLKFEPPLVFSLPYGTEFSHAEMRIQNWLELMVDDWCEFSIERGEALTSLLDFEVVVRPIGEGDESPDVYWEDLEEWPEYGEDSFGLSTDDSEEVTKPGEMGIDLSRNAEWDEEGVEEFIDLVTSCGSNQQESEDSLPLEDKLNEVSDEMDQKRVEEMDQRAVEYMRENREVFKAEIADVSYGGNDIVDLKLDIPTLDGYSTHHLQLPEDGEYSGDGKTEKVIKYLGITLKELHMVEGMYLPVSFDDNSWTVQFPGDGRSSSMWSSFASPEIIMTSGYIMAGITTVVGLFYSFNIMMISVFLWIVTFYGLWKTIQRDTEP